MNQTRRPSSEMTLSSIAVEISWWACEYWLESTAIWCSPPVPREAPSGPLRFLNGFSKKALPRASEKALPRASEMDRKMVQHRSRGVADSDQADFQQTLYFSWFSNVLGLREVPNCQGKVSNTLIMF